jgi:hypothetical protein
MSITANLCAILERSAHARLKVLPDGGAFAALALFARLGISRRKCQVPPDSGPSAKCDLVFQKFCLMPVHAGVSGNAIEALVRLL